MRTSIALIILLFVITGCKHNRTQENTVQDSLSRTITRLPAGDPVIYPDNRDIIHLDLREGSAEVRFYKKEDQTVYLEFDGGENTHVHAELSSEDPDANIRFSQIFIPGETTDGPFGRELDYDLQGVSGIYHLSIHENIMEGEPWSGIVTATIQLSK